MNGKGQTPLDEDEKLGLLVDSITLKEELNELEQQNIEDAVLWVIGNSFSAKEILNEAFIKLLHKKMFGNVWGWAGTFRLTNKNIGVDKWAISQNLRQLLDDAEFWIENQSFPPDELAITIKHRIVSIHCFPNGNGRHSRLLADIVIEKIFGKPVFTWGSLLKMKSKKVRTLYLESLRKADKGDLRSLVQFARS